MRGQHRGVPAPTNPSQLHADTEYMVENEKYSKEQMVGNPTGTREILPQDITHKRLRFVRGQHRSVPAPTNLPQLHEMVPYIYHI